MTENFSLSRPVWWDKEKFHFCAEFAHCQVTSLPADLHPRGPFCLILMLLYYMESFRFIPGTLLHLISSGKVTWHFVWLWQTTEELRHQLAAQQKVIEQHKSHINKCIDVVKKLLKEKSNIEKKEARQKCMQNRLRLGQFVTQRVGATFQENWTDGYAFQELARYVYYLFPRCFLVVVIMYDLGSSK